MKKTKLFRVLFMLAVAVTVIAASAAVASAVSVNKNADYKYTKTFDDGTVVAFTQDVFTNRIVSGNADALYCKITIPDGISFEKDSQGNHLTKFEIQGTSVGKWEFGDRVAYGALDLGDDAYCGSYRLLVGTDWGEYKYAVPFEYGAKKPTKIDITTYPNKVALNTYYVDASKSGKSTWLSVNGIEQYITNGWGESQWLTGFKAGKKYDFTFYGTINVDGKTYVGSPYVVKNVPMGPSVKPVISSVKISNVKSSKYFDTSEWRYKYKTSYTIKVTLSKKASNSLGAYIKIAGTNGLNNAYKTVKGTGKTFTAKVTMKSPVTYKGKKVKVSVRTYHNKTYGAYSYESKAKTVTIK